MESSLTAGDRAALKDISKLWWLWLVFGIAWTLAALVILQFDQASVHLVGVIIGIMFIGTAIQCFAIAGIAEHGRWLYLLFGVMFIACGVLSIISPENTFAALADILGFLFFLVGVFWIIQAMVAKDVNELWWVGLVAGILMIVLAFWTGGQFFIEKSYVLLIFAGIWALMQGVTDLIRAFQIKKIGQLV